MYDSSSHSFQTVWIECILIPNSPQKLYEIVKHKKMNNNHYTEHLLPTMGSVFPKREAPGITRQWFFVCLDRSNLGGVLAVNKSQNNGFWISRVLHGKDLFYWDARVWSYTTWLEPFRKTAWSARGWLIGGNSKRKRHKRTKMILRVLQNSIFCRIQTGLSLRNLELRVLCDF